MDIGTLAAFTAYAVGIFEPIQRLAGILSQCISAQANIERVTSLLEEKPQVIDLSLIHISKAGSGKYSGKW